MKNVEIDGLHPSCHVGGECCSDPCGPVYRNEAYYQGGENNDLGLIDSPPERASFERSQINQLRQINPRQLKFITGAVSMGMISGSFANQEAALWYRDAQTVLAEQAESEERPKPPKRPRGKARRIGGFALGNT